MVRGDEPSLAANDAIAPLLAPGTVARDLVSAIIAKGTVLQAATPRPPATPAARPSPALLPAGTPVVSPVGEEVDTVLFGIARPREGRSPVAMTILLTFDDIDAATSTVLRVERALRHDSSPLTGQPYTTRLEPLGLRIVGTSDGPAVLLLQADLVRGPADWLAIVQERDLGFVAWEPRDAGE